MQIWLWGKKINKWKKLLPHNGWLLISSPASGRYRPGFSTRLTRDKFMSLVQSDENIWENVIRFLRASRTQLFHSSPFVLFSTYTDQAILAPACVRTCARPQRWVLSGSRKINFICLPHCIINLSFPSCGKGWGERGESQRYSHSGEPNLTRVAQFPQKQLLLLGPRAATH